MRKMENEVTLPAYANKLRPHEEYQVTFFRSAPDAPKDWAWINEHGVFMHPRTVLKITDKKSYLVIKVAHDHGLYAAGYDFTINIPNLFTGGCSGPSVHSALRDGYTSEQEAVKASFERIYRSLREAEKTALYREFDAWAKAYGKPKLEQLSLF